MKEGSIVLASLRQSDGKFKPRPVLILKQMPKYNDLLVCGISSQLSQLIEGFDEIVDEKDEDFSVTGLLKSSVIRIGFLSVLPQKDILGTIGNIETNRHKRLLKNLSEYIVK